MEVLTIDAPHEAATVQFGAALAAALPRRAVIALIGPLGAGKTRLVQAIAYAAGVEQGAVASPTFVLVHEYEGRVPIFHFDAYRLRGPDEFMALGSDEYFSREGWTIVEWANRVTDRLPLERLEIKIEPTGTDSRRFIVCAHGPAYADLISALAGWQPVSTKR